MGGVMALSWHFWAYALAGLTICFLAALFYLLWTNQKADEWCAEHHGRDADE